MLDGKLPAHLPVDPHFTPSYFPYDQRVTLTPDGDFFKCLRSGKGDVKTGVVKQVVTDGILVQTTTKEGDSVNEDLFLGADIIVTATGLKIQIGGGITFEVDGKSVSPSDQML